QAVDVDPANPAAIGELARHYERQNDLQSLRIHLDRAAGRFRPLLRERPRDPALYRALPDIFRWRRTTDLATLPAGALSALGPRARTTRGGRCRFTPSSRPSRHRSS